MHVVEAVAAGRMPWRVRRIAPVWEALPGGAAIVVAALARLGRSMLECMKILALATRQGIRFYAVKGNWPLDQRSQSKLIALAFSRAAEIERDLIAPRTQEAVRCKQEQGIRMGSAQGAG